MLKIEKVLVQLGNATKVHTANQFEIKGRLRTTLGCGSKSIRGMRVLDFEAQLDRFEFCEKCEARGGGQ